MNRKLILLAVLAALFAASAASGLVKLASDLGDARAELRTTHAALSTESEARAAAEALADALSFTRKSTLTDVEAAFAESKTISTTPEGMELQWFDKDGTYIITDIELQYLVAGDEKAYNEAIQSLTKSGGYAKWVQCRFTERTDKADGVADKVWAAGYCSYEDPAAHVNASSKKS